MKVPELVEKLNNLWPWRGEGLKAWAEQYARALRGYEGPDLQTAFDQVMEGWTKTSRPMPADFVNACKAVKAKATSTSGSTGHPRPASRSAAADMARADAALRTELGQKLLQEGIAFTLWLGVRDGEISSVADVTPAMISKWKVAHADFLRQWGELQRLVNVPGGGSPTDRAMLIMANGIIEREADLVQRFSNSHIMPRRAAPVPAELAPPPAQGAQPTLPDVTLAAMQARREEREERLAAQLKEEGDMAPPPPPEGPDWEPEPDYYGQ